jgi:uncharacterized membrane protein
VAELQPVLVGSVDYKMRPLRGMVVCLVLGLILATVAFVEHATLYVVVLGLFLCLAGPMLYSWFRGQLDYFEPIHVFGAVYFAFFGLGSVWTVNDPHFVAYDLYIVPYVPKAALYCLLGYVALIIGYYGPWRGGEKRRPSVERLRGPLFLVVAAGVGIVGLWAVGVQERLILTGSTTVKTLISSLTQLFPFFLFAWALAWVLFFSDTLRRMQKLVLLGVMIPAALFAGLSTFSDKSLIMTLIGVPIIARWYMKRKIPWSFLVILLLLLVFIVFPFYNTYRWSDASMAQSDRMMVTYQTVQSWDSDRYLFFSVRSLIRRLAMINSVAVVLRDVDRWVPYARGKTIFMPALTFFIPRVLWPDKPVSYFGRDFGRTFRVTSYLSKDTFIAVTVPGELYWNFGLPGILLGMALLGMGLRVLYRRYGEGMGRDVVSLAIYILLLIQVAHLGASLAGDLVVIFRTLVLLEAMRWFGRRMGLLEN